MKNLKLQKRKLLWGLLAVMWLLVVVIVLWVLEERERMILDYQQRKVSGCWLVSEVELCYRPQDVLSTECVYDRANNSYLRFVPSETTCVSLSHPDELGIIYTRLQWTSTCGDCLEDVQWERRPIDIWGTDTESLGNGNEGFALKQCYDRCRDSILLNYEWCAEACRCVLGTERCGPLPEGMEQS